MSRSANGNFDWLVDGKIGGKWGVVQVTAQEMSCEGGCLVFWAPERQYVVAAYGLGEWSAAAIMSQITGFQNAFDVIAKQD